MTQEIKINETHLIILKKNVGDKCISLDYLPIINPLTGLLNDAYKKCTDEILNKDYANEILDSDERLRGVILQEYDFCQSLDRAYQGLDKYSSLHYAYKEEYKIQQELDDEIIADKKNLKKILEVYGLAYATSLLYNDIESNNTILAHSHRRRGWNYPVFSLTSDLSVKFKTNFGYGNSSFFCTELEYKGVEIVLFSDWVSYPYTECFVNSYESRIKYNARYKYINYGEVLNYTARYALINESWQPAMEFIKDAANLCINDEDAFINLYIVDECRRLITGLKNILSEQKGVNSFDKKRIRVRYKGEKVSGALNFTSHMLKFKKITDIKGFVDEIEDMCMSLLPELIQELGHNSHDLYLAKIELLSHEPEYVQAKDKYTFLRDKKDRILTLEKRCKNSHQHARVANLQKLFNSKHNDFDEIKDKYFKVNEKHSNFKSTIEIFDAYSDSFNEYIEKINNHFK
jgi:hypothetical protein